MKKLFTYFAILLSIVFYSCQDELDVDGMTTFAPTVFSASPNVSVKLGTFDLKAVVVTGPDAPLTSGTLTLKDATGKQLFTLTKSLTGIKDSVIAKASEFNSSTLPLGSYTLEVTALNAKGLSTTSSSTFKISQTLYPANNTVMYIAGEFNGWSYNEMTLISDFTWEIKNVDLQGKAWKLKNTKDWTDQDWGDGECDGLMSSNKSDAGSKNTDCKYSGLVNVQFNDQTLKYTVKPAVNFKTTLSGLYALGTFNNFAGEQYKFSLKSDNTWELDEIRLKPGDEFKLSESPYFKGKNYGDSGTDGLAAEYTTNFTRKNSDADAYYKLTFNDATLKYTVALVRYPYPEKMFLVGGVTSAGWTPTAAIPFVNTGSGTFEIYAHLNSGDGFKFLPTNVDFSGDWGVNPSTAGAIIQDGESNASVGTSGFYRITLDFVNKTYTTTLTDWGIIGDATPAGWDNDTNMTYVSGYTWAIDVTLTSGAFKFRANDGWGINFGDGGSGKLAFNSNNNIPSPGAGSYHIEMILDPVNGYTYTVTPN